MNKDKLADIKYRYMDVEYDYALKSEDIDWLIDRAERYDEVVRGAIKLHEENKHYREEISDFRMTLHNIAFRSHYLLSVEEVEEMARLLGVAKYKERFVIPTGRREMDDNLYYEQGACSLEDLAPAEGVNPAFAYLKARDSQ